MSDNITAEQKILKAELLVDYLLLGEQDWALTALTAIQTAQGLGRDAEKLYAAARKWREKRAEKRKQNKALE